MLKQILVSIVRHSISVYVGWLVKGEFITGAMGLWLEIAAAIFIVNVLWSVTAHLLKRWHIRLALLLPKGAEIDDLKAVAQSVPKLEKFKQAVKEETVIDRAA